MPAGKIITVAIFPFARYSRRRLTKSLPSAAQKGWIFTVICGLHHIAVLCSRREPSLAFYRDALGFCVLQTHLRPERGDEILMLEGYGITLELFAAPDHPARLSGPEALGLRHLALRVTELEQLVSRLSELGYEPEPIRRDSFTQEKMTFVKDPDGLPIELHE